MHSSKAKHPNQEQPQTHWPETHWFGYQPTNAADKTKRVGQVFANVAKRYDLMNDLMSLGIHRLWKREFVAALAPRAGEVIIDVAGGTGDIAKLILAKTNQQAQVTLCDINQAMLMVGRTRLLNSGYCPQFVVGNAEALPMADNSADAITIAFGLRNVTHIDKALAEMARVLKPGGRAFILEFSAVTVPVLADFYDQYSFKVLPRLGQMVAGDKAAYQYLAESIRQFPKQTALVKKMQAAGLAQVAYRNLARGIAAIHSGWKI